MFTTNGKTYSDTSGKKIHLLKDLYRIKFSPYIYPQYYDKTAFESGKQQLLHLIIKSIIKDNENSSNYQSLEPSQTGYGQDIINSDLVNQANIILAVFKHKLGTPTINPNNLQKRSDSGTAEELLSAIRNKKLENEPLGMAYFYYEAPVISLPQLISIL